MGLSNACVPYFDDGDELTGTPTAAVLGKHFVAISGNQSVDGPFAIAPPIAGGEVFGVASWDAAVGEVVPVLRGFDLIVPVVCAAALAAGQAVQVDATGAVIPLAAGAKVGTCLTAAASGADAMISLAV